MKTPTFTLKEALSLEQSMGVLSDLVIKLVIINKNGKKNKALTKKVRRLAKINMEKEFILKSLKG